MQIDLNPEYQELFERAAEKAGMSLEAYVRAQINQLGLKLWHIERSKPKSKAPPNPPGRPRLSSEEKSLRDLASYLNSVYTKLKQLHGADYEAQFGEQEREYLQLIENKDLTGLSEFSKEQRWQKRR